jgi:hypothetical protein
VLENHLNIRLKKLKVNSINIKGNHRKSKYIKVKKIVHKNIERDKNMTIYECGETYVHRLKIKDRDDNVVYPTTVKITLTDKCNNNLVDGQSMVSDASGTYEYKYTIPDDCVYGKRNVKVVATDAGGNKTIFSDVFYVFPWDAVDQVRELSGITSKKSIDDDTISRIIWEAYEETLEKVYSLRKNESFLCNPDTGDWINGTNKIFEVKNPPIADYNGDGQVSGKGQLTCGEDITLLWKDANGTCSIGKVTVLESECGKIQLTQSDDSALPSDLKWAKVTYHTEWHTFRVDLLRKAVSYLAAYECLIRFTNLGGTTQADLNPNVVKFNVRRKSLPAKYKEVLRLIKKPVVGGSMLPGK